MSHEEFKRTRLGKVENLFDFDMSDLLPLESETLFNLPDAFDSRVEFKDCIHPIRDQARCGSCWAFSASEVLSDRMCIETNGTVNVVLSP